MINYSDELKKLRFNFNPEEIIDYQALITLAGSIIVSDNYDLIGKQFILECIDDKGNIGKVEFIIGGEL